MYDTNIINREWHTANYSVCRANDQFAVAKVKRNEAEKMVRNAEETSQTISVALLFAQKSYDNAFRVLSDARTASQKIASQEVKKEANALREWHTANHNACRNVDQANLAMLQAQCILNTLIAKHDAARSDVTTATNQLSIAQQVLQNANEARQLAETTLNQIEDAMK